MDKPLPVRAVEALKAGDRDRAIELLREDLATGPETGERWRSINVLAREIGEVDLAIETARRFALTEPIELRRQLHYWSTLAAYGREDDAEAAMRDLPASLRKHPDILHFRATLAVENGEFEEGERLFRELIAAATTPERGWFPLAMTKTFTPDDPDIEAMEKVRSGLTRGDPDQIARLHYALGKAYDDIGDADRAFMRIEQGANIRRQVDKYDRDAMAAYVESLIEGFDPDGIAKLAPSRFEGCRSLFVSGLPRSGSTLVEQILTSHSEIVDGGEINLLIPSLIPARRRDLAGALAYQQRSDSPDPWGDCARTYERLLSERFGASGRVVDKTLIQSHPLPLQFHMLPDAKMVWMRRDPENSAWSCYSNFFTRSVPWSWSLDDIAHFFRLEDRLYEHWTAMYSDRILTAQYEELAQDPEKHIPKILAHFGLDEEDGVYRSHENVRRVKTASVKQVRAPIAPRTGKAALYHDKMEPFRRHYFGNA